MKQAPTAIAWGRMHDELVRWLTSHGFSLEAPETIPSLTPEDTIEPYGRSVWHYEASLRGCLIWGRQEHVCLCIGPAPSGVSIHGEGPVLVVLRPCGARYCEWLSQELPRMAKDVNCSFIVKNVGEVEAERLVRESDYLRFYRDGEWWNRVAREDEQTYPEVVLNLSDSIRPRGSLRLSRRAVVEGDDGMDVRRVFDGWLRWFRCRHSEWRERELRRYYSFFVGSGKEARYRYSYVYSLGAKPVAFVCGDPVKHGQVDFWTCFCVSSPPGISRAVYADFFNRLREDGIRWVNLGGSEEPSLHGFKLGLGASERLRRRHVVCTVGDE